MKKVLSFVLILALVLSSFSMAFAASATELKSLSDIEGNKNQEAIEVNYDLGIVTGNPDGTFQPEKAVTRAEFAAMITRALAIPQSALAGYANTSFTDTSGYGWAVPYLAFCNSKGIMLGDGAGNAMPGKTITVNEAVTMSLRAIGYVANSSELVGVWPSNYVTKAQELKMYDDVAKDAVGVDKANAAQIIYNTLTVQKVAVNSDGKTEKQWDKEPKTTGTPEEIAGTPTTLLSSGLDCTSEKGIVGLGYIDTDDTLINIAKHIGKYGTVYKNSDEEVVAFISDCDMITGTFYNNTSGEIKFVATSDEKEYNIKNAVTVGAVSLDNGQNGILADSTASVAIADGRLASYLGTEFTLSVDLSGKTIKEIYTAIPWSVTTANKVDATDIAQIKDDQSLLGEDFTLDDNDEIDYTQFQLVGVNSLLDIKENNIVYVYTGANKEIRRVEVGTQVVEGTVKSFKNAKDGIATKFAIGANTYHNAEEVIYNVAGNEGNKSVDIDNVADDVKAYLDARGFVYEFSDSTSANNFAVVEKFSGAGINEQAKLMLADGTEKTFGFDVDGEIRDHISTEAGMAAYGGATPADGTNIGRVPANKLNLIGYGLNKDGDISEVNTNSAFIMKAANHGATLSSISVIKWTTDGSITNTATIADDAVVFTYDKAKDEYDVSAIDKVETDEDLLSGTVGVTLLFDDGDNPMVQKEVVAMIVDKTVAKGGTSSYAVFNELNKISNDDGDKVWQAVGFMDGKKLDAETDDFWTVGTITPVYTGAGTLDAFVYEVKVDANGRITDTKVINTNISDKTEKTLVKNVADVNGRKSVNDGTNDYSLSKTVAIYQVNDKHEYNLYSGSLKKGDEFILYEVDDDADGYDIVVFYR